MKTLILLALVIVVAWVLFRPFSQRELDRYKNRYKNNDWPDIEVWLILNKLTKKKVKSSTIFGKSYSLKGEFF